MDNKQMSIQIINKISQFFDISDTQKQEMFHKMAGFSDDKIDQLAILLLDFEQKKEADEKNMLHSLHLINHKIEEASEKKDFEKNIHIFFDNL